MHEKNIALLCDEADRLLQLNINLLRQMVEEPDVLSDSKNENRLLFDKQKALKRIEELQEHCLRRFFAIYRQSTGLTI
ncbi:TPA: hypothetical protein KMA75_003749 [Escherichia coli]|nr:hypothetical protein EYX79_06835 [Escherichia coli]HAM0389748.1 hypothetical protein [Escherichia coli]HBE5397986.1 hypothetical protein [Escherichia coli]